MVTATTPTQGMLIPYNIPAGLTPQDYNDYLITYDRRGFAKLMVLLEKAKRKKKLTSRYHHWGEKPRQSRQANITGVYTDSSLSTSYTAGAGVAGTNLYLKTSTANSRLHFNAGDTGVIVQTGFAQYPVRCYVVRQGQYNGTSYVHVLLLEADSQSKIAATSSSIDTNIFVTGNANPSGSPTRTALLYHPVSYMNQCQIWKNSINLAADTILEKQYYGIDAKKEARRETLVAHNTDKEYTLLFGKLGEQAAENADQMLLTMGMEDYIETYAASNVHNFKTDSSDKVAGKSWEDAGLYFMYKYVEEMTQFGLQNKLGVCGSAAINALAWVCMNFKNAQFAMGATTSIFGVNVTEFKTPMGSFALTEHPLLSEVTAYKSSIFFFDPEHVNICPLRDQDFREVGASTMHDSSTDLVDAYTAEFLTQACFEFNVPESFSIWHGIDMDAVNTVS